MKKKILVRVRSKLHSEEISRILSASKESRFLDFKEKFDPNSMGDWCEIIKDVAAFANSGGGFIVIGLRNDGQPSGYDISNLLEIDSAVFTDKFASYTGEQFSDFSIDDYRKRGCKVAVIKIGPSFIPVVFTRPGTYALDNKKQKMSFSQGTVYFRHGAKSEPATTNDLRQVIEKKIHQARKDWFQNVRKVSNIPMGHSIKILPPEVMESSSPSATPIRLVDDPNAPAYKRLNFNELYPYRQIDVVNFINERSKSSRKINSYDIYCVRKVYKIDGNQTYFYKPKFGSPQYTTAFASWLLDQVSEQINFFEKVRKTTKKLSK